MGCGRMLFTRVMCLLCSAASKKERVRRRSAAAAAVALTDERPITGWVSSLRGGDESAVMAFTDGK